jgi:glycerol-3-phosphate acyltransferase PlsX
VIRIAIDAMGGDHAPAVPVAGAALALGELPADVTVQLVGQPRLIERELERHATDRARVEVIDAPDAIAMGEKPLQAIRSKRNSSIAIGIGLQKSGESDAFISAGNTGAVMAGSILILGLYAGFERPAIGATFPTSRQSVLVLDAGANVDCSPTELVGFAHLGAIYARDVMGRSNPAVGLLNIGEEEEKGNAAAKEAYRLLRGSGLPFVGNVEGRHILLGRSEAGDFDVVVCDGFVGNVLLKFYESLGRLLHGLVERELGAATAANESMSRIWRALDYAEYGGAPLLGVKGVSIICHGRSTAHAIRNAVRLAAEAAQHQLVQHMAREFSQDRAAS